MSLDKNHPATTDLMGRVLSLEQRVRGLHGRIAAIEVRLSVPQASAPADSPDVEFVPATIMEGVHATDMQNPGRVPGSAETAAGPGLPGLRNRGKEPYELSGLIAGLILVGAGILLYLGNFDMIRNPIVVVGCGVLLLSSALLRRKVW